MAKGLNRFEVAKNVGKLITELDSFKAKHGWYNKPLIRDVCDELEIFDWWNDKLSISQLKAMQSFLKTAEKLGYNGYVCFKVGASGCANGMWAYKAESETGFSPDGEFLYRSFTPDYICWDAQLANGGFASDNKRNDLTLKDVMEAIGA